MKRWMRHRVGASQSGKQTVWLLAALIAAACEPVVPGMPDGAYAVRGTSPKGNCPPAALWSLDETFAEPDLLVISKSGQQAQTIRRRSARNDTQLYEMESTIEGRVTLTARDTTWCGKAVDRWELRPNKSSGFGGIRSMQLKVPPRCERLCTATVSTVVGPLVDPAPKAEPAQFAGWAEASPAPTALPLPVAAQVDPVRFEREPDDRIEYAVLGAVGGTWGLVSASPRWLVAPEDKRRGNLTLEMLGAGRPVRTLGGRAGQLRGLTWRSVPSHWTEGASLLAFDVGIPAREPADVAIVVGTTALTWAPLTPSPLTLSAGDAAAIEAELPWTNTIETPATEEEAKRIFPELLPLHLGTAADGTRWLTVRQGKEPSGEGWLGVSLLRGAKDGTWARWVHYDVLVTEAMAVAVLQTPTGPAVISVGHCRNGESPAYAVSTSDHTDELALDCGV